MNYQTLGAAVGSAHADKNVKSPLKITNIGDKDLIISANQSATINNRNPYLKYRVNNSEDYQEWVFDNTTTYKYDDITLPPLSSVEFIGENEEFRVKDTLLLNFIISGEGIASVTGNILSLVRGNNLSNNDISIGNTKCFNGNYYTSGGKDYYKGLFANCERIKSVAFLPEVTASSYGYSYMFWKCTSLESAPNLTAKDLPNAAYTCMFYECTSLLRAPELPATNLTTSCYLEMFYGCSSLESTPKLSAQHIPTQAYSNMFRNCEKLEYVECLATLITKNSTKTWLQGVASSGTFAKAINMTDWESGESGIPTGWTVENID